VADKSPLPRSREADARRREVAQRTVASLANGHRLTLAAMPGCIAAGLSIARPQAAAAWSTRAVRIGVIARPGGSPDLIEPAMGGKPATR